MKSIYWLLISVIMILTNAFLLGMERSWNPILWLVGFVVLLGAETISMDLTTVWFAIGGITAYLFSMLGIGFIPQLVIFNFVSIILLMFVRPAAVKKINLNVSKTNVDAVIGEEVYVIEEINFKEGTGKIILNGIEWTARSVNKEEIFPIDIMVKIEFVEGVKVLVSKI